jgi:hypothetical protein
MYDSNGDGYIDFREFMIVLYIMSNGSPEANLKQIFRIFDINGDGSISQKEMVRIVKDLFHLLNSNDNPDQSSGEDLATTAFKEMDINLDGQVSEILGLTELWGPGVKLRMALWVPPLARRELLWWREKQFKKLASGQDKICLSKASHFILLPGVARGVPARVPGPREDQHHAGAQDHRRLHRRRRVRVTVEPDDSRLNAP